MSEPGKPTEVQPFRGIRYDADRAGGLSSLLCPPYDIISDRQRLELYARSPHNMIRLEYPLPPAGESTDDTERYVLAARLFREWMAQGVLKQDASPALYVHDHSFVFRGRRHVRRGLFARVGLRPWYGGVYPHELTGTKAKQDRLELMRACHVSFSGPIGLYEDREGGISKLLEEAVDGISYVDVEEMVDRHRFRAVRDPAIIARIGAAFAGESIYIADGHHRYETALVYQQERRSAESGVVPHGQAWDYIAMTLTAFSDPGLFISPVYRVLTGLEMPGVAEIEAGLSRYFSIDYVPVGTALARSAPVGEMALMAVAGLRQGMLAELRKRPGVDLGAEVPGEHSSEYRTFNVSILNHVVMAKVLRVNPDGEGVTYSPDVEAVVDLVQSGRAQMAFLLTPAHPMLVKKIADQQERMPRKSTYFYPKPPTGLVAYPLD
ncbi:MAG: DUF1015 domain-containing protein [Dehalococcoidia bacterium]|jgi:uncharacterized protein (DUF1015 family)|nr:DUF1015 domain-containing protein [Dehalococcoidia bacterium]